MLVILDMMGWKKVVDFNYKDNYSIKVRLTPPLEVLVNYSKKVQRGDGHCDVEFIPSGKMSDGMPIYEACV